MLKNVSRAWLAGAWCSTIVAIGACSVVAGVPLTVGSGELLLVACLVPPAVMLLVWHGAPPVTVAELLHSVEESSADGRL